MGLYSAFLACKAIFFRSSLQPRFTVETMFCSCGTIPGSADAGVMGVMGGPGVDGNRPALAECGVEPAPVGVAPEE